MARKCWSGRAHATILLLGLCLLLPSAALAQLSAVSGFVTDQKGQPVEFATLLLKECGLWAVSDERGAFHLRQVPCGRQTLVVQCLGYVSLSMPLDVDRNVTGLKLMLTEKSLRLSEVEVTARRRDDESTTSYTIDRTTLDHQQVLNLTDIATLLPGGKTQNSTLMSDDRLSLRSSTQEKGNAAFGTAIEVDGVRLDNNGMMGETLSSSTRNVGTSAIESVEIVTGIPSVEYGDLSNGVVKISTRRGKSPFIVEASLNPHTRHVALNKGTDLGTHAGLLNVSAEHTRSFSDMASPYTSYQRNVLTLNYANTLWRDSHPLTVNASLTGNVGGYDSKGDPDEMLDSYVKTRDNVLRASAEGHWLLNQKWITNLTVAASLSMQDKLSENYYNTASASAQPYLHTLSEGYFIARDYADAASHASDGGAVVLGPTGYWYVRQYADQKPTSCHLKIKADWTRRTGGVLSRLMTGADYTSSRNRGRGTYYDDMSVAPTWREYRYDRLPAMNNVALYAEEKVTMTTAPLSSLQLTAGLRHDITIVSGSDYGTANSLSPRLNGRYVFWQGQRQRLLSTLEVHAGWGKSVKLPSFQVLYPAPAYTDLLAFTPGSTPDGKAYYAYYTYPSSAIYNPALRWQYTNQVDLGVEARIGEVKVALSAFYHRTKQTYMAVSRYTPFQYKVTGQSAIERSGVQSADRQYAIDQQTGIVTLTDRSGIHAPEQLDYTLHNTYNVNREYTNGSPVERYGLEWVVDFAQIRSLHTSLRLDGNYYRYRGTDETLFAGTMTGAGDATAGMQYPLIGYYRGSAATSAGTAASASVANGSESEQVNLNATLTTHVPRVSMVVTLRVESSLYHYRRALSELGSGSRAIALNDVADNFGEPYDATMRDRYVALYPEYYSTWDNPTLLIPFAQKLQWALQNDPQLYSQLARMVVKTNYAYTMNPNRLSHYLSANISVTKEIGRHVSVSFYANNFFNNMGLVRSSQTGQRTSLFDSGYIPRFYYGMSVRVKI